MRYFLCLALAISLAHTAGAQQFGGNRPSLKWRQVDSDTVRVIFPAGLETQGKRVADVIHRIARSHTGTLGPVVRKINIVLQHETMQSNGFVQLGPFRSVFYLTPPPNSSDLGSLNWADQLALHEYRHVIQNNNFRKGISKAGYYVFGELGQAAITNIAVPNWFWEGDAVVAETAMSEQGRGRLPAFFDGFRALKLAGKDYSYMQIRNGSYRRYMPDHYETGYLMTSYGRLQHGRDFWKNVTDDAVRFRGVFYPFSQSLKRRTGKNAAAFFHASYDYYRQNWNSPPAEPADTLDVNVTHLTKSNGVENFRYVYPDGKGGLVVLHNSYQTIPAFYNIYGGSRPRAFRMTAPGTGFDNFFSYRSGHLLWTESRYSARWGADERSVVVIYKPGSLNNRRVLQHERRCFSPDLSHNLKSVVVAALTPEQRYSLEILDAGTGQVLQRLPNPENWYYTYPKFTDDDQWIVTAVRDSTGRMAIVKQPVAGGNTETLVPFAMKAIGIPVVQGDTVYFTAAFADVDDIYSVPLAGGTVRRHSHRANGVHHLAVADGKFVFSEFTANGFKLLSMPLNAGEPIDPAANHQKPWLQPDFGEGGNLLAEVRDEGRNVRKYAKGHRLFNFHSWLPVIDDPDYGWYLLGENVLGTLQTRIGAGYNRNESSPSVGGQVAWAGWFPVLRAGGDYKSDRYVNINDTVQVRWNELDWYGGMSLPLRLSSGKFYRGLTLSADFHQVTRTRAGNSKYQFRDNNLQYLDLGFSFSNQRMKALQQIYSHFGQTLAMRYSKSLNNIPAEQFFGRADLYFPGFRNTHNIVVQLSYLQKDTSLRYAFSDPFSYARGYSKPFFQHVFKVGSNYHFPLVYPDWGFANLLYFSRVRANVFHDFMSAFNFRNRRHVTYASAGGELYFDTKIGNVLPFTFGMRYSQLFNDNPGDPSRKGRFELIVPLQQLFSY
ncbi:hypothetical protein [Chitinophaga caseinilytica]|uniref:DUF4157 domain-containing protein n=1 Tax=Chitinophaga caseinilytica TaxID=2267521 RepID=A0ABZ2Z2X5_9BACT